jgi:hypothetical protein
MFYCIVFEKAKKNFLLKNNLLFQECFSVFEK